ncbi:MAG: T9SS type A sorting domain-containing protein, partial [Saprospiraceae bacterium]|nr:T9SS type A sorting domain-containing protein [Saprospiraceae bacterium]
GTTWTPPIPLEKNTLYYVQVRARNICIEGDWTPVSVFHTENFACNMITQNDPLVIPQSTQVVESILPVAINGTVSDLNVGLVDIDYTPLTSLIIKLISPTGGEETLFDKNCGGDNKILIGFDDQATNPIPCPPNTGQSYLPEGGMLSNYTGQGTLGDWKLQIETTIDAFDNGSLNSWSLELCSDFQPEGPFIEANEVLAVKTDDAQWVSPDKLQVKDNDNTAGELTFTIVEAPLNGTLENFSGASLGVGDTFTQQEVNDYTIKYVDGPNGESSDSFVFVVTDGTGGFLLPTTFQISIDDNNDPISGVQSLSLESYSLFPNPTREQVEIFSSKSPSERFVEVLSANGQVLKSLNWNSSSSLQVQVNDYPAGVYFLRIREGKAWGTLKFVKME